MLTLAACGAPPPAPPPRDGGPRDAAPPPDSGAVDAEAPDAEVPDAEAPDAQTPAIDAGPPPCTIDLAGDLMVVGRDTSTTVRPRIATASSASELVAVFADDGDGERRIRIARVPTSGTATVRRETLAGAPLGAGAPAIVQIGDGWLIAFESGGAILVQRYSASFAAEGAASTIVATGGARPAITQVGTAAFVAWAEGTRMMGRSLSAMGAPTAAATELGTLPAASASFALRRYGVVGDALAAIGSVEGTPTRTRARRIISTGVPAVGSIMLGSTDEAEGGVDVGSGTTSAPSGTEPLEGSAVWDVNIGGFRALRFALLATDGMPAFGESTVSESGEPAWGGAVTPFGQGYVIAYRARPAEGGFSRVRLGFMERESCRLGRVDARMTVASSGSELGGSPALAVRGTELLVAWAEVLVDVIEYRVATLSCM